MSINYAILGILSYKSMTGYDLKKIIQDTTFMYWSGNNNQVYKSLSELLDQGMVTNEVKHQAGFPTKKIYEITSEGLVALKEWVLSPVEPSDIKKPFLIHLAWCKQLKTSELNILIDEYEKQVKIQLLMEQKKQDNSFSPDRSALEATIWSFIKDNIQRTYENELVWIQELRNAISNIPNENDENTNRKELIQEEKSNGTMKYKVNHNEESTYIHFNDSKHKLETESSEQEVVRIFSDIEAAEKWFLSLGKKEGF